MDKLESKCIRPLVHEKMCKYLFFAPLSEKILIIFFYGCLLPNIVNIGSVVLEKKHITDRKTDRWTTSQVSLLSYTGYHTV